MWARDPNSAYEYARYVLRGLFKLGEPAIAALTTLGIPSLEPVESLSYRRLLAKYPKDLARLK